MRLLWLPEVLRAAGLTVHEVSGWRERGSSTFEPRGGICHATAGSSTSTDAGEIGVLLNGSNSAPPPIAQLYLSRSGAVHVVASGRCNHALTGQPGTPLAGLGNTNLIGIEAQNDNRGQAWTPAQLDAYVRMCAAIARKMGWSASRWIAHREHQPSGKTDPVGINMAAFRESVARIISGGTMTHPNSDFTQPLGQGPAGIAEHQRSTGIAYAWYHALIARQNTEAIMAEQAAQRVLLQGILDAIKSADGDVDVAGIMEGLDARLNAMREESEARQARADAEMRDAVADLGEGGAAQVRADA